MRASGEASLSQVQTCDAVRPIGAGGGWLVGWRDVTAKRAAVVLTAGLALLVPSACTTTITGSGTGATSTASGRPSSTAGGQPSSTPSTAATTGTGLVPYKGDRFTVSMPGRPVKSSQQVPSAAGPVTLTQLIVEKDGTAFNVAYGDYPAGIQIDLPGAARGSASGMKGKLADLKQTSYRGRPAVDFRIDNALGGTVTGFARDLAVDNRVYQLFVVVFGTDVTTPPPEYLMMRDSLTF